MKGHECHSDPMPPGDRHAAFGPRSKGFGQNQAMVNETKLRGLLDNITFGAKGVKQRDGVHLDTLVAYARSAYSALMVFVELTPFIAFRSIAFT